MPLHQRIAHDACRNRTRESGVHVVPSAFAAAKSERLDSNQRPRAPEARALTKLRYVPNRTSTTRMARVATPARQMDRLGVEPRATMYSRPAFVDALP